MTTREARVAADHGLPLHVERSGRPPGPGVPTFLLVHGYAASLFSWRTWAPELRRRGHVVLVDLKGFGAAPRPDDDGYGPRDQAELVVELIRRLDLRRLTLGGHSMGGGVALLAALLLRDDAGDRHRLERLILVAGAAYRQRLPPFAHLARFPRLGRFLLEAVGARRIARWTLRAIVHDRSTVTEGQIEGYAAPLRVEGTPEALLAAARRIVPPDLDRIVPRYPSLDLPTLLLWGRQDPVVPVWVGERLRDELPRARLEVLDGCGHLVLEEHPGESVRRLGRFLAATSGGAVAERA